MSKNKEQRTGVRSHNTLYDTVEAWLSKYERTVSWVLTGASLLFALLLFDTKLSTGGDDAAYVLQAREIVSKGTVPLGFRVPGYPIVLSLFVLLDRTSVIVLKFSSILFFVGTVASFYYIFRTKLTRVFLFTAMLVFAMSGLALEYAHQTYSEILYLLVQLWAIHFFFRSEAPGADRWKNLGLAVFFGMLSFYVRSVGFTLLVAMGLVWLLKREWKVAAAAVAFSGLLYLPLKIAERMQGMQGMQQASILFLANPYNPSQGNETLGGFAERMWNNFVVHAQYMIPRSLGLPVADELAAADGRILPNASAFFSILISGIVLWGMWRMMREKDSGLRVLSLYSVVYLVAIFFLLHNVYATSRMMVPLVPIVALALLFGVESLLDRRTKTETARPGSGKRIVLVLIVGILLSNAVTLWTSVGANIPVLKENLRGNEFYGYSPDWVNYLNASVWVRKNLPKDSSGVICRKPEMFQIYAGSYTAHGVYQVESTDPDTIVAHWKEWKMTHLMYDNFQWTATLRRYVQPVGQKYPAMFELVHQEGESAPTFIYRLNYSAAVPK